MLVIDYNTQLTIFIFMIKLKTCLLSQEHTETHITHNLNYFKVMDLNAGCIYTDIMRVRYLKMEAVN